VSLPQYTSSCIKNGKDLKAWKGELRVLLLLDRDVLDGSG
jgi:hypothetical protein